MNDTFGPDRPDRRPDPRDPRRGDWRDRWSDDEAHDPADPQGDRAGEGYADATERLPVTDDYRDDDYGDDDYGGRGYGASDRDSYDGDSYGGGYGGGGYDDLDLDDGGPDPVRDFFAAHRAQIREHEADDLTWQQIRREARAADGSRRRAWLTGAGIAASLAVVGLVLSQAFKGGDEPPAPAPPPTITTDGTAMTGEPERTTEAPTGTEEPTTPAPTTAAAPTTESAAEEATGTDEAPTTDGPGQTQPEEPSEDPTEAVVVPPVIEDGFANPPMGMGDRLASVRQVGCDSSESGWCSILYLSEDGGQTWGEPIELEALGLSQVDRTDELLWGWGPGGLKRSDDLGATWTDVPHRGAQVLRVNAWAEEMMVITGECGGEGCTDVEVSLVDPATEDATDGPVSRIGELRQVPGLPRRTQEAIYLSDPGPVLPGSELWRIPITGGEATLLTPSEHCPGEGAIATEVTGVPRSQDDLIMACQSFEGGSDAPVELLRSVDGGGSWSPLAKVETPDPRMCGLSSGDGRDIVLAVFDGIWVSHDSGSTFTRTVEHPPGEGCSISEIVYGAGTTYVGRAMSTEGPGNPAAYYRSVDAGDTWRFVVVD